MKTCLSIIQQIQIGIDSKLNVLEFSKLQELQRMDQKSQNHNTTRSKKLKIKLKTLYLQMSRNIKQELDPSLKQDSLAPQ